MEKLNEPELIRYDILEAFIMTGIDNRSVNTIRGPSQIEITLLISRLILSLAEIFFPQKITCLHHSGPPFHPKVYGLHQWKKLTFFTKSILRKDTIEELDK